MVLICSTRLTAQLHQLYRCFILWQSSYLAVLFPSLVFLGSIGANRFHIISAKGRPSDCAVTAVSVLALVAAGSPEGNYFTGLAQQFGIAYYALTVGLNIMVTALICARLLHMSKRICAALGPEKAGMYTSVTTMLLESAALYSITGIMFIIPYARDSETSIIFGDLYGAASVSPIDDLFISRSTEMCPVEQCLSPMLIVYRVVTRKSWERNTLDKALSSLAFVSQSCNDTEGEAAQSHVAPVYLMADIPLKQGITLSQVEIADTSPDVQLANRAEIGLSTAVKQENDANDCQI